MEGLDDALNVGLHVREALKVVDSERLLVLENDGDRIIDNVLVGLLD